MRTKLILGLVFVLFTIVIFGYNYFKEVKADNVLFSETFLTTAKKDVDLTTGKWDTVLGQARLLGKDWVNMAETKDGSEVLIDGILNNISDVEYDSADNPYIVGVVDSAGVNLPFLLKWSPGIGWTDMSGNLGYEILDNSSLSTGTIQMALDSSDNPYIVWNKQVSSVPIEYGIYFSKWTVGAGEAVCGSGITDCWTNMKMDASGSEEITQIISNGFTLTQVADIKIDSGDYAHIIFRDDSGSGDTDLYYTKWNGVTWSKADGSNLDPLIYENDNLSNTPTFNEGGGVLYLVNDSPLVTWYAIDTTDVFFTKWTPGPGSCANPIGCWTSMDELSLGPEKIDQPNPSTSYIGGNAQNNIKIASNNDIYVSWEAGGVTPDVYMVKGSIGSGWTQIDGSAGYTNVSNSLGVSSDLSSFVLDAINNPYIVWRERVGGTNYEVYFARWNGSSFVKMDGTPAPENVSNSAVTGTTLPLIALDSLNTAYVLYTEPSIGLLLKKWSGTIWGKIDGTAGYELLNSTANLYASSLNIINDDPQVVFRVGFLGTASANFTKYLPDYKNSSIIQSTQIDTSGDFIKSASLTATDTILGGTNINYFISNNGGGDWYSVPGDGTLFNFPALGADLRWKAELSGTASVTPIIEDLNITFQTKKLYCSLSPTSVLQGQSVVISATTGFAASSVWATVEKDGTVLSTVNLIGGPNDWSYSLATASQNMGQNDVAVFATDGTDSYVCNPSTGAEWKEMIPNDMPWSERQKLEVVNFQGKMWIVGGSTGSLNKTDIWSSSDGLNWDLETASPGWAPRTENSVIVYKNKIWTLGGFVITSSGAINFYNDVWNSSDGKNWNKVCDPDAPLPDPCSGKIVGTDIWKKRTFPSLTVFDPDGAGPIGEKLWLAGGCDGVNISNTCNSAIDDVWNTEDGITWTKLKNEGSGSPGDRVNFSFTSYNSKLWILGGNNPATSVFYNDIYSSANGTAWTLEGAAGWAARQNRYIPTFDSGTGQKFWMVGGTAGIRYADVWSSPDLVNWTCEVGSGVCNKALPAQNFPGVLDHTPRIDNYFVAKSYPAVMNFKDKLWLLGGSYGSRVTNEIWTSTNGLDWSLLGINMNNPKYGAIFGARFDPQLISYDPDEMSGLIPNKLYLIGGVLRNRDLPTTNQVTNDVWTSTDGVNWTCLKGPWTPVSNNVTCTSNNALSFPAAWDQKVVVFDPPAPSGIPKAIWVIGGCKNIGAPTCALANRSNDSWYSTDGENWTCASGNTPGCAVSALPLRIAFNVSVFNDGTGDKLWATGGWDSVANVYYNEVYYSADGTTWTKVPVDAAWPKRAFHESLIFNDGAGDKLCVIGGYNWPPTTRYKDMWCTATPMIGGSWTRVTPIAGAPWLGRYAFGALNYYDQLFVVSGNVDKFYNLDSRDVWKSGDGFNWTQTLSDAPFRGSDFYPATVFDNRMWVQGGGDSYGGLVNNLWASTYDYSDMNFSVVEPGGGGTNCGDMVPEDPTDVVPACQALTSNFISWNFQDNAVCENGYNLYEAGTDIKIKFVEIPNLSSIEENSGLSANTQYSRYVKAYNAAGESAPTAVSSCFTLAKTPKQPIILSVTDTEIVLQIDPNDDNPAGTEYAIKELNSNEFVQADGTFGAEKVWQTYGNWGADSGVTIVGLLLSDQAYSFVVIARNGDAIETAPSVSVSSTTPVLPAKAPDMIAAKGVAINLALNRSSFFGRIAQAAGVFVLGNTNNPNASIIDEFSFLLNFILLVLVIILIINLFKTAQYLKQDSNCKKCLGVIWLLLINEPAKVYIDHAAKDSEGNYIISYDAHKKSHLFGRKTLLGVLSILALKLIILLTLIFGLAKVNHLGIAQTAPYDQTGQQVNVGDTLNYVIEFANQGTDVAKDIVVTDNLDSNLSYEANSAKIRIGLADITGGVVVSGNSLIFNLGNLNPDDSGYITFKASVSEGAEEQTINNLAQVSGSNFSDVFTNSTSNLVMAVVVPLCGNKVIDPVEQCDQSATPTGCASDETCVNCRCQEIPPLPVCGNGIREAGEQCDPIGCGADQICINCICQSNINTNINTNTNEIPPIPPIPPITPPTTPPTIPPSIPPSGPGGINQPIFPPDIPIISAIFNPIFNLILDPVNTILENKQVEQVSQNVITPMLLAVAALTIIPAILATSIFVLPYLHLIFLEPFLLLFGKKRKKWGIVYNSLSKVPIDLALVRLYSQSDNRLIQTRVTDKEGRYLFVVSNPGRYYISVTKPGFSYPTKYLKDEKQDTKYLDLYHGEMLDVTEKNAVITANIPLDLAEQKALPIKEVITSYFVKNLRLVVSYIGMILALLIVLIYPTVITIGALMVHIALFLIFRRLQVPPKPKSWGIIYDTNTKEPLSQSVVRIFDLKFNKLLETQITDKNGRYSFLVGKNEYQLLTEKEGYKPKEVKPVDLVKNEQVINMDVGLQKT